MNFKDYFSSQASAYSEHRPHYPAELFDWLASLAPHREQAWDCATGSGQAALALAEHFERVLASDASAAQIANAIPHPRIDYHVASAEDSGLAANSVQLVSVAQAYHWLNHAAFAVEADRVLQSGGLLAVWGYANQRAGSDVDPILLRYYGEVVGAYWPTERYHVETGYRNLPLPFDELPVTDFEMSAEWTREQLLAYLGTWSATQRYIGAGHTDPLPALDAEIAEHWADATPRRVRWPLFMRLSRKP